MGDWDFFVLASQNIPLLIFSFALAILLSALVVNKVLGFSIYNPVNYYYTVTIGFGYGVVFFLMFNNALTPLSYYIVFGFGILFIIALRYFKRKKYTLKALTGWMRISVVNTSNHLNLYLIYVLGIYLFLSLIIVIGKGGLTLQEESRFEANAGLGSFVRLCEYLKYAILALFTMKFVRCYKSHRRVQGFVILLFTLGFIYYSSLIIGSKGAFLECIYCIVFVNSLLQNPLRVKRKYVILIFGIVGAAAISWVYYTLSQNLLAYGIDSSMEDSQYFTGTGFYTEKFILRLLNYGDMYYYSLPNDVIAKIHIDNVFFRFMHPFVGAGTIDKIFEVQNTNDMELGRQLMLYHNPDFDLFVGPTNHFDLTAYVYFGPIIGAVFVIIIAFFMAAVFNLKHKLNELSDSMLPLYVSLWMQALILLLHPAIGISNLVFVIVLFFMVNIVFKIFVLFLNKPNYRFT